MRLPQKFVSKMQELLGDEWAKIVAEWKNQGHSGLRVNTLKLEPEEYYKKVPRGLERIPWTAEGFILMAIFVLQSMLITMPDCITFRNRVQWPLFRVWI